jgi:CheY-like chemotaxis protein
MTQLHARVLVVEDSEELRELLVLLLEGDGYGVVACENADQAFALVRRERPDLIVTDLMLGATSGLSLITRIRSDLVPPIPPIVACSGFTGFEHEALQRGAVAFIPKPFDVGTIRSAVTAVLARRDLLQHERAEAAARSRSLRAEAVAAADAVARRLAPRMEDITRRCRWSAEFLPRYFGFGEAFVALITDAELQIKMSSQQETWQPGKPVELGLCHDMMETRSALLISDLLSLGSTIPAPDGNALRFFSGVPLVSGAIPIGALCFVDHAPRAFGADGYALLQACGQRASAVLSDHDWEIAPLWAPSGLLSRGGLCVVLAAELTRLAHEALTVALVVFAGGVPHLRLPERAALAELDEQRLAVVLTRHEDAGPRELLELVEQIARGDEFEGAGVVTLEDGAASSFDPWSLVRVAETLMASALSCGPRTISRLVIRREPHAQQSSSR